MERPLTPEERKKINAAYKEADPTTFSQLPPTGSLQEVGESEPLVMNRTYPFVTDGENTYVEIPRSRAPARQQAVTRILKGVVNVSDMVTDGWLHYSKVMPLESIEKTHSDAEIHADLLLLDAVFGDWDHQYRDDGTHKQNIRSEDGKVAYFDFNEARPDIRSGHMAAKLNVSEDQPEVLRAFSHKLGLLLERYDSEEGKELLGIILDSVDTDTGNLFNPRPRNSDEQEMDPKTRFIEGFITRVRLNKLIADGRLEHFW